MSTKLKNKPYRRPNEINGRTPADLRLVARNAMVLALGDRRAREYVRWLAEGGRVWTGD